MKETIEEFIQEFRNRIGDSSESVPQEYIMSYINTVIRRASRMDGMDRLFQKKITKELSTINADGTPSAAWNLGALGRIIDIYTFRVLKPTDSRVVEIRPIYKEYDDFFACFALPEQAPAGDPDYFTFEQISASNKLLFNRPLGSIVVIEAIISAFPNKVKSINEDVPVAWEYSDFLLEAVIILHKIETTDMSTARALYEDLDTMMLDIKETLARRKTTLGYRRVKRSF